MPPKVPEIQAVYNQSAFWTQAAAALATKFCPKIAFQFHIKKQQNEVTILIWTEQSTHLHCEMIWNSNAACFWSKKHVFGYIKCINNTKTAASPMENKSQISHVGHNWHARLKHLHAKDLFSRKGANAARLGYGSGLVSFLQKGLRARALFEWLKHSGLPPTHPPTSWEKLRRSLNGCCDPKLQKLNVKSGFVCWPQLTDRQASFFCKRGPKLTGYPPRKLKKRWVGTRALFKQ